MKSIAVLVGTAGLAAAVLTVALDASAADDPVAAGAKIVQQGNDNGAAACSACHGADGAGNAAAKYPRLAGMNANYLAKQLQDYKAKTRNHAVMAPVVAALSDAEIQAVSAYFAQLEPPASAKGTDDEKLLTRGEKIARYGVWSKDVPACNQCHGPGGTGIAPHFPAIAGQHASYIEAQFAAWKSGERHNDPNDLMKGVAERLSDDEIKAVSAYFASRPADSSNEQ